MNSNEQILIGPLTQVVTMANLPSAGPLKDSQLEIIPNAGIRFSNGKIIEVGDFSQIKRASDRHILIEKPMVALPGFLDAHTHLCWAGRRSTDYALRLQGATYTEIAANGGGILDTVRHTRTASKSSLMDALKIRLHEALKGGVTTCEIKSGYGLSVPSEIKMLEVIEEVKHLQPVQLLSTCLAAHVLPPEFSTTSAYLKHIVDALLPLIKERSLATRLDIFVEKGAFSSEVALPYLLEAKKQGFSLILHADQFSRGGALLAAKVGALSADHLEVSEEADFIALKKGNVIPIVLPGASLGLGLPFAPARALLDHGLPLVIASDWNPGSAPMGRLLTAAALMGAAEHLSMAETLAAITVRAAAALECTDRGLLTAEKNADFLLFETDDFRDILYHQGSLLPTTVFIKGISYVCN